MPGIAILERMRFAIENSIQEGHELSGCDILVQQTVDLGAYSRRAFPVLRKRAHRGLHIGHQQSGGHTFANDVGDTDPELVIAKLEHVVVISAHSAGGLPRSCDLEAWKLGNVSWQ